MILILAFVLQVAGVRSEYHWNCSFLGEYSSLLWRGWLTTSAISIAALVLSLVLGMLLVLAGQSCWLLLRSFHRIVVELIRGAPLLVQILIFFYVVADAYGIENRYIAKCLQNLEGLYA
ncbi:MAG: hypothetical protein M2R45_04229 [Verrucomicrobia subdivision 3 bacterium]|nr:hypothetical protein [Limisphaerales bacterium]MCS1417034.1 hypothetical protein [Limisphaerales bacterium]